jgi:hypothetical protein
MAIRQRLYKAKHWEGLSYWNDGEGLSQFCSGGLERYFNLGRAREIWFCAARSLPLASRQEAYRVRLTYLNLPVLRVECRDGVHEEALYYSTGRRLHKLAGPKPFWLWVEVPDAD